MGEGIDNSFFKEAFEKYMEQLRNLSPEQIEEMIKQQLAELEEKLKKLEDG